MKINTRNFGEINVQEEKIITFKEGIPGFENLKKFILIEEKDSVFHYLQSVEDGEIRFIITDPYCFKKDYQPTIKETYFEKLGGGADDEFSLYVVVTLKDNTQDSTLNLAGPLLIHVEHRSGIQVITEDKDYTTRHKIVELINERG